MMALLTKEQRARRFEYLGLGEYNKANIKKFQKMAFPNNKGEQDGKYGIKTDRALRTFYNVKKYAPSFKPEEFRCNCGHCCGYPSYMKKVELEHIQAIRDHYKKPMEITCGLRCDYENTRVGGVANSGHLKGYAVDFYMKGVTDNVENRTKALKWIKKQPNHEFTYGANMKDSNGVYRYAEGMGNAMHTETHKVIKTPQDKICDTAKAIADSGKYKYVFFNTKYGKECAICHPHNGENEGWQCIGYAIASWHHSGIPCRCNCEVFTNQIWEKMMNGSSDNATAIARQRLGINDVTAIRSKSGIPLSKLKRGDIVAWFVGNSYKHTGIYLGNGLIADCTSTRKINIKCGVKTYTSMTIKVAVRYTGK